MTLVFILMGAVIWDLLLGEPSARFHPVVYMGKYISALWRYRPSGKEKALLVFGGALVLSLIHLFIIPARFLAIFPNFFYALLAIPMLKTTFSLAGLLEAGEGVLTSLERGDLAGARKKLSRDLVSRETDDLSPSEAAGAAIESLAENLTDSVASPLFFFGVLGLPGAFFYRFCNTCDSTIGYRGGDMEWGGKFAARCDDVLNWVPARISAFFMLAAGALAGEDLLGGIEALRRERVFTASPNAGWTMAVMAGLLGVTLEKRDAYSLAGGDAAPDEESLRRAIKVVRFASALTLVAAAILSGLHGLFR